MRSQTLRAVESILETDPGVSDEQRNAVMGVLRGEAPTLSSANRDMMAEVMKLLETAALPKTYMRRNEAAEYLGCSHRDIDKMKHDGDVPFCRLSGRLIVFKRADLDALMERRRVAVGESRRKSWNAAG
jgi:excisionase family DNA binding protein